MMILTINKGMKERTNFNAVRLVPDSDRVQQAMKLKDLKYVVPVMRPSDDMGIVMPDAVYVYLEDSEGHSTLLLVDSTENSRNDPKSEMKYNADFNKILNRFDLLPSGKIIGLNWTMWKALTYAAGIKHLPEDMVDQLEQRFHAVVFTVKDSGSGIKRNQFGLPIL